MQNTSNTSNMNLVNINVELIESNFVSTFTIVEHLICDDYTTRF